MGEEACNRSWEREIYWTHFQCIHFAQFLRSGFYQRLAVPESFARNLKKKLPDTVTLKGPCGAVWKVGLTTNSDHTWFFDHGWTEFVEDHCLEENDILIFKYNGDSQFDVLMFEGENMCEKPSSYFVRKCQRSECECQAKRKDGGSSAEGITAIGKDDAGGSLPDKSTPIDIDKIPIRPRVLPQSTETRTRRKIRTLQSVRLEVPTVSPEELKAKHDTKRTSHSPKVASSFPYLSSRAVTEREKKNALQLAVASVTDNGFVAVMKPCHVYKSFYMTIPTPWMIKHLPSLGHQSVILRLNEKTWDAKFHYRRTRNYGYISAGWRNFVIDNRLHEFDVCVFEPVGLINSLVGLDVSIFRAAQEVSPVTPVTGR